MNDINNLQGLDKAAILFQVLGEALALSMFQNISESDIMKIRIRSRELQNIPVDIKKSIVEEYYFKMMSKQYHQTISKEDKLFSFLNDAHERQAKVIVEREMPGAFVCTSSDVANVLREYERFSTAAMNAFVGPSTS